MSSKSDQRSSKHVSSSTKTVRPIKPVDGSTSDSDGIEDVPTPSQKNREHKDKPKSVERSSKDERHKSSSSKDTREKGESSSQSTRERSESSSTREKPVVSADAKKLPYKASDDEIVENWDKWDLRGNDARGEEARKNLRGVVERIRLHKKLNPNSDVISDPELFDELKSAYEDYMNAYPSGPRMHQTSDPEERRAKKERNAARKSALLGDSSKRAKILEYPVENLSDKAQEIRALYLHLQSTTSQASALLHQLAVTEKAVQSLLKELDDNLEE